MEAQTGDRNGREDCQTGPVSGNKRRGIAISMAGILASLSLGLHSVAYAASEYEKKVDAVNSDPAFNAQLKDIASQFIRNPASSIVALCTSKFPLGAEHDAERDACLIMSAQPVQALSDKSVHRMRLMMEVFCEKGRALSQSAQGDPKLSKIVPDNRCNRDQLQRARALANGAAPKNCLEVSWLVPSPDRTWAILPAPNGATKYLDGELVNFRNNRYTIRQALEQAELEQIERNVSSAAAMINSLGKQSRLQQKFAIVDVSRSTKSFNPNSIQLNRLVEVVGTYRNNGTLTLTNGAQVPAPIIEAICIQGAEN